MFENLINDLLILEFPMCPLRIGGLKIPIAGGFYLRMFPLPFLSWGLKKINQSQPFIPYVHPWGSYDKTPRLKLPLHNRIILYYTIGSVTIKLEHFLKKFFITGVIRALGLG
jgi:hypothetical protein